MLFNKEKPKKYMLFGEKKLTQIEKSWFGRTSRYIPFPLLGTNLFQILVRFFPFLMFVQTSATCTSIFLKIVLLC